LALGTHSEVHGRNTDPARHMVALATDNVRADWKRLKEAGVEFVEDPTDYGNLRIATLKDPEGNLVQLLEPLGTWPRICRKGHRFGPWFNRHSSIDSWSLWAYTSARRPRVLQPQECEVRDMADTKEQLQKMKSHPGFIAALDQSGGSTPGALRAYGIKDGSWANDEEMFTIVPQMRTRIMTSPAFTGERVLAAILFENTMDRSIEGQPSADYLWNVKRVVPFLKVDKGLVAEQNGVQLMKPMPELAALLGRAKAKRIFGTKMRSVIKQANSVGVKA